MEDVGTVGVEVLSAEFVNVEEDEMDGVGIVGEGLDLHCVGGGDDVGTMVVDVAEEDALGHEGVVGE